MISSVRLLVVYIVLKTTNLHQNYFLLFFPLLAVSTTTSLCDAHERYVFHNSATTLAAATCKFSGTKRKFKNWKGIQMFQFAITVGAKSCLSLGTISLALPSIVNSELKNTHKNAGANKP